MQSRVSFFFFSRIWQPPKPMSFQIFKLRFLLHFSTKFSVWVPVSKLFPSSTISDKNHLEPCLDEAAIPPWTAAGRAPPRPHQAPPSTTPLWPIKALSEPVLLQQTARRFVNYNSRKSDLKFWTNSENKVCFRFCDAFKRCCSSC